MKIDTAQLEDAVDAIKAATCLLELAFDNLGSPENFVSRMIKERVPEVADYIVLVLIQDQLDALGHAVYHVGDLARGLADKYGGDAPADVLPKKVEDVA